MSAIGGIVSFARRLEPELLARLREALRIYGIDTQASWLHENAGLVRTLRRLTPEDEFDVQPIHAHGNRVVVFSGRIDNRDEIAGALDIEKSRLQAMADSALVALAYARWSEECLSRLIGAFTFAVWEPHAQRLFLARDQLGVRPLYWHHNNRLFAFASSALALRLMPGVLQAIDEERLADYLALIPKPGPQSLYKDVQRLEPGHYLVLDKDSVRVTQYHRFDPDRRIVLQSDTDYVEAFREHLLRAVRCCLRSNGPIASHLSSGFDSSTVTAIGAKMLSARAEVLTSFTAVPPDGFAGPVPGNRHADESVAAAELVAKHENIDHVRVPSVGELVPLMRDYAVAAGQPVLNGCNLTWADAICEQAAQRGIRVIVTGLFGNLTLSHSGMTLLPELVRSGRWIRWARESSALRKVEGMRWRSVLAAGVGPFIPATVWRYVARQSDLFSYSAIHPELARRVDIYSRAARAGFDLNYRHWRDSRAMRLMALGRRDMGDEYLATMAHYGVEQRSPALDLRLVEFSLAIPEEQSLRMGQNRWLLRRAFGDMLPGSIKHSKTTGCQAPNWFELATAQRAAIREELELLTHSETAKRCIDLPALLTAERNWPSGGWDRSEVIETYRLKLLRGLAIGIFIRTVEGGADSLDAHRLAEA